MISNTSHVKIKSPVRFLSSLFPGSQQTNSSKFRICFSIDGLTTLTSSSRLKINPNQLSIRERQQHMTIDCEVAQCVYMQVHSNMIAFVIIFVKNPPYKRNCTTVKIVPWGPQEQPVGPGYKGKSHMATKRSSLFLTRCAKGPVAGQDLFPRVSPLCGHKGKLKGTSEKARGVPLIFLAPYFVNHTSPETSASKFYQILRLKKTERWRIFGWPCLWNSSLIN